MTKVFCVYKYTANQRTAGVSKADTCCSDAYNERISKKAQRLENQSTDKMAQCLTCRCMEILKGILRSLMAVISDIANG
jgi:hypothetical protein